MLSMVPCSMVHSRCQLLRVAELQLELKLRCCKLIAVTALCRDLEQFCKKDGKS